MPSHSPSYLLVPTTQHRVAAVLRHQHKRGTLGRRLCLKLALGQATGRPDLRILIEALFHWSNLALNNARGSHGNDL